MYSILPAPQNERTVTHHHRWAGGHKHFSWCLNKCPGGDSYQKHPRKQSKNITQCQHESNRCFFSVLQGQSDLLRGAKMDSLDALRQLALACEACVLTSSNSSSSTFSTAERHYSSHPLPACQSNTQGNGRIWCTLPQAKNGVDGVITKDTRVKESQKNSRRC